MYNFYAANLFVVGKNIFGVKKGRLTFRACFRVRRKCFVVGGSAAAAFKTRAPTELEETTKYLLPSSTSTNFYEEETS
jgi:hypothetical protein